MAHALERTSPKGTPFIGQCTKCGKENVTLAMMHEHCVNPANITDTEALELALRIPSAIKGDKS